MKILNLLKKKLSFVDIEISREKFCLLLPITVNLRLVEYFLILIVPFPGVINST